MSLAVLGGSEMWVKWWMAMDGYGLALNLGEFYSKPTLKTQQILVEVVQSSKLMGVQVMIHTYGCSNLTGELSNQSESQKISKIPSLQGLNSSLQNVFFEKLPLFRPKR